jgi:hypothetical protein
VALSQQIDHFHRSVMSRPSRKKTQKYVHNVLTLVYPQHLTPLIGEERTEEFVSAVEQIGRRSKSAQIVCDALLPRLRNELMDEASREESRVKRALAAEDTTPQEPPASDTDGPPDRVARGLRRWWSSPARRSAGRCAASWRTVPRRPTRRS